MSMEFQIHPHQLRKILSDAKTEDLEAELRKRATSRLSGLCDHCHKQLYSEPVCSIPYRHEGREPEDWEGLCDTPRISSDRETMHYWRDDMSHVTRSRFPCNCSGREVISGDHPSSKGRDRPCLDHSPVGYTRVHIECDGQGCDYEFCENGLVRKQIDFGDKELRSKWPEDVISFTSVRKPKPKKKRASRKSKIL